MKLYIFFTFAILAGVYSLDDLDDASLKIEKNVEYQIYRDNSASLSAECEEHEEYSECFGDPTCRKTCENMDHWETMACVKTKVCIRGCICKDGYVRNDRICINETTCPRTRR
ncbi:hypothetical protein P5V15_006877 [Pogonomyrmex californicus]